MTLTHDTLLYNVSLPIHDLTSWRLTAHQWLDLTFKYPLRVDDSCWWLNIRHSLYIDDLMSAHSLCVNIFDVWHPALQWLTAHPWLDVLTSHSSAMTWHSNTHCVLVTHVDDLTSDSIARWWLDVRSLTCWWLWRPVTHYVSVSVILTWHSVTNCVQMT